ncbi:hypothetical protein [Raoultella terrigena]|uniref:hypothetical protein n=1 Tax=Raoultella terrigena TaxID=577 RepID=UPI00132F8F9C|nr:hypothetical protein [Raoultella terrigena]
MRETVSLYGKGEFTQGSVFSGLETSAGNPCMGIIITARCDLEHRKLNKIVCLPVYRFLDWMTLYGDDDIFEKSKSDVIQQLDALLVKYGLSYDSFRVFKSTEVIRILTEKRIKKADQDKIEQFSSFLENKKLKCGVKSVLENEKKYLESLFNHSKANVYFIEGLLGDTSEAYIIDLGEPITLSIQVIVDIDKILYFQKYNRKKNTLYKNLHINESEESKFFSTLNSPYAEHLLQRFSQFYNRIGTEDISSDILSIIKDIYEKR